MISYKSKIAFWRNQGKIKRQGKGFVPFVKSHYFFKPKKNGMGKTARIYFRKTFSNMFLTITDLHNKVVYTLSGGRCAKINNKRFKIYPFVLERMASRISGHLRLYKIFNLEIRVRSHMHSHLKVLVKKLSSYGFKIQSILDMRIVAHNGVRARALKRR